MRSMTGFGEKRFAAPGLRVKISIKSLNHRFFDWSYKGTPSASSKTGCGRWPSGGSSRGRVEAAVDIDFLDPTSWEVEINDALLEKILETTWKRPPGGWASRRVSPLDSIFRIPQLVELRRRDLTAPRKILPGEGLRQNPGRCRQGKAPGGPGDRPPGSGQHLGPVRRSPADDQEPGPDPAAPSSGRS